MRQAGRYLPEYREIRAKAATLSRILLDARARRSRRRCNRSAGSASTRRSCSPISSSCPTRSARASRFESGEGPRLDPIDDAAALSRLREEPDWNEARRRCSRRSTASRSPLPEDVALIGFCGAPWTVASYMIAGRGTPDQAPARLFAYRHPDLFAAPDRPAGRRLSGISVPSIRGGRGGRADLRFLGRRAAAGRIRALVRRADRGAGRQGSGRRRRMRGSSSFRAAPGTQLTKFAGIAEIDAISLDTSVEPSGGRRGAARAVRPAGQSRSAGAGRGRNALDARNRAHPRRGSGPARIFSISATASCPRRRSSHVERLVARVRRERAP